MSGDNDWARTALRLEELAREQADAHDVDTSLEGSLQVAVHVGSCDVASVSLRRGRDIETTAATDAVAARAHERQLELDEGPCLDAEWDADGLHVVEDLGDEQRWPRWSPEARDLGLSSLMAVRLFTHERTIGALDLYSLRTCHYDEDDVLSAKMIAARVSASLAQAQQEEYLWEAIDIRHQIGQAQGILMERYGLSADVAFGVLRRYSQEENRRLHDVVAQLLQEHIQPDH